MDVVLLLLFVAAAVGLVSLVVMVVARDANKGFAIFVLACCLAALGLYAGLLAAWLELFGNGI